MKRLLRDIIKFILLAVVIAAHFAVYAKESETTPEASSYANAELLVEVEWLAEQVDNPDVRVVDVRPADEYNSGHIPNAVLIDLTLLDVTVDGIPGQITDPETVGAVLGLVGVTPDKTIVIYDDSDHLYAARLFWILEYHGYEDARLLNGGWEAWTDADMTVSSDVLEVESGEELKLTPVAGRIVDGEWLLDNLDDPDLTIIDARGAGEYAGTAGQTVNRGHIPGAHSLDWTLNIADGLFKSAGELAELYAPLELSEDGLIVVYCSIGYRASVDYFTLRLLGYEQVAVYDGSWAEWGNEADWPFERS
jgi:thiosulfate/3-mercaptopyruvate sulfurtransferase